MTDNLVISDEWVDSGGVCGRPFDADVTLGGEITASLADFIQVD